MIVSKHYYSTVKRVQYFAKSHDIYLTCSNRIVPYLESVLLYTNFENRIGH